MRIAIVHSFYSSGVPSGENNVVLAQITALEEEGHEVQLIAQYTDEVSTSPTYKLRTAFNVMTQGGASPLDALEEFRPDVVHVHNLFPNFSRKWLRSWAGPVVATIHNFRPVCAAGTLFREGQPCTECIDIGSQRAVLNRCYRGSAIASIPLAVQTRTGVHSDLIVQRANKLIVLADRAHELYSSLGIRREKMALLPNFVDQQNYRPAAMAGNSWIYIGRLAPEKGVLNLIRAWPQDQELRIYGDGPLKSEVNSLAMRVSNIRYEGSVASSDIPAILSDSRGLVFPSEWPEGAPLVYVEALAAGRPVVAKVGSSVADDVAAKDTGLVYSNYDELSGKLNTVKDEWTVFHANAIRRFESTFSAKAWVRKIEEIYSNVIEEWQSR